MKKKEAMAGSAAFMLLLAVLGMSSASAANVMEIVRETQRVTESNGQLTMAWWLPQQFWEEGTKANAGMPPEVRTQVLTGLSDYMVIVMLRAKSANAGLSDVQPKAELIKNVRVEVNGKTVLPLAPEQVAPVAQLLLAQLKPGLVSMAGALGGAMELVVYPAKSADGKPLLDATQTGSVKITLYEVAFNWRLPLGSLLPVRVDKKTGEEFPGSFQFNPYTGDKLNIR